MAHAQTKVQDASKMELAKEVANTCAKQTDPDRCEAAYKISKCVSEEAQAKGVQMDELEVSE